MHPAQSWRDFATTHRQQAAIEVQPVRMRRPLDATPVQLAALEGCRIHRVGDAGASPGRAKPLEMGKGLASVDGDVLYQVRVEIAEVQEGLGGSEFLAHEQRRGHRRRSEVATIAPSGRGGVN